MSLFKDGMNISSILLMIIQGSGHVYLLYHKSDSLEKFKEYKTEVEIQLGKTIKTLRLHRNGEYEDLRFQGYLIEYRIQSQLFASSTLKQNSVSERRNQTLLDIVRFIIIKPFSKLVLNKIFKDVIDKPSSSTKVVDKIRKSG